MLAPLPPLINRASTHLPCICVQFWEHLGYHHWCICFPTINYVSYDQDGIVLMGFIILSGFMVLTNELGKKLPAAFLEQVLGGVSGVYCTIPLIAGL